MKDKITAIMPVYILNPELLDLTEEAIKSLGDIPLIIVDNGSLVGGNWLRDWADLYIRGKENKGYPWAVNQGIKLAETEFLAIANNDIRVSPNYLEVAEEIFKDPEVGSVHFRMIPYDEPFSFGNEVWKSGKERWCSSSFFIIRKKVIEQVGMYDEYYGIFGYDDYDFWGRVRKIGIKTAYTNKACYQHRDSSTALVLDPTDRQKSVEKNREYYKKKHGEYPDQQFARLFPEQMKEAWKPFP